ncbi:MAG TPA: alpha/beta hydrolase, partial [Candidatus Melainabacteria bacterium]|nr:alpha/beta hydrolase [Candidatus Melainabacteria bacterium]
MKSRVLAVRDTELYVESPSDLQELEPSKPSLILLHGLTSSCALNDRLAFPDWLSLKECFPVYRYDARGHGRSKQERQPDNFAWRNLALDLIALVEILGLSDQGLDSARQNYQA